MTVTPAPQWPANTPPVPWVTAGEVTALWPESIDLEPDVLATLLAAATEQCAEFAPTLPVGAAVPTAWRLAVVMQARALYRASIAGGNDQVGMDGMTVTVFPLDWQVQRLLRPKKGRYQLR